MDIKNDDAVEVQQERKKDHIELAFKSQLQLSQLDGRFDYEPLLASPFAEKLKPFEFLGKTVKAPLWVSSMTGGTELARKINQNLAKACREFGLGMGLGSCRILLESNARWEDFDLRDILGDGPLLFANLGIAQVEMMLAEDKSDLIIKLVERLRADGLIVHVNPLQEWLQPEGDRYTQAPLETIQRLLEKVKFKVIVKEVGQGMGPKSLKALFKLPLAAIDFGAYGGTNFSQLELLRSNEAMQVYENLTRVGHAAEDMVDTVNRILEDLKGSRRCSQVIISGGVKSFLDGYYLTQKVQLPALYGQASALLFYARSSYEDLKFYIQSQIKGLELAQAILRVKEGKPS